MFNIQKLEFINTAVVEHVFPSDITGFLITEKEAYWTYSFAHTHDKIIDGKEELSVSVTFYLFKIKEGEEVDGKGEEVVKIKILNSFLIPYMPDAAETAGCVCELLKLTSYNLQGYYAAKTYGSALKGLRLPLNDFQEHREDIIKNITNDRNRQR